MIVLLLSLGCRNKDFAADSGLLLESVPDTGGIDEDLDGYLAFEDCDDNDAAVHPGANEVCNGIDDDCNDLVDDAVGDLWYTDADGDTYGDAATEAQSCEGEGDQVADATDCDDTNAAVHPDADEICDGLDNDCEGDIDEDVLLTFYEDADTDGFGDASSTASACEAPSGFVSDATDCDDTQAAVSPDADEVCNDIDDDCDGDIDDDAIDASVWYLDDDSDGHGGSTSLADCDQPSSYVDNTDDCDDADGDISPDADEECDSVDNDCDGDVDEDSAIDADTWYADSDGDGYGDASTSTQACDQPSNYVDDTDDCDDTDGDVNPDAEDVCDGVDNDCDGDIDPTGVDTDGDGVDNCIDSDVWEYDWSSGTLSDWTEEDLGGSNSPNWNISGSYVCESSNAAYTVLAGPDLGELDAWTYSADVYIGGAATDYLGLVFDYVDDDNFWVARVNDPTDYYTRFSPPGQVELVQCVAGTCTTLDSDDTHDFTLAYNTAVVMSVSVDDADISISWDGTEVLTYTHTTSPVGAGTIGFFSYDNDSGACYGNPEVTNP